jgi:hypothetical protein
MAYTLYPGYPFLPTIPVMVSKTYMNFGTRPGRDSIFHSNFNNIPELQIELDRGIEVSTCITYHSSSRYNY